MKMKILIVMPHIFAPKSDSLYSSNNEGKREAKSKALYRATIENLNQHNKNAWIHTPRKKDKKVVTRKITSENSVDLKIQVYTKRERNLVENLPKHEKLEIILCDNTEDTEIPQYASKSVLEQAEKYDILGYIEDDILIEDAEFFDKIRFLMDILPNNYTVLPHRCEWVDEKGDVILSGDPEGGRNDLFWDTGEKIKFEWGRVSRTIYRATNPHSGCFFLSREQAINVRTFWQKRDWNSPFMLSGPLEHAASGRLIECLKIMKTVPSDYRFLKVKHCDELWKRHDFDDREETLQPGRELREW